MHETHFAFFASAICAAGGGSGGGCDRTLRPDAKITDNNDDEEDDDENDETDNDDDDDDVDDNNRSALRRCIHLQRNDGATEAEEYRGRKREWERTMNVDMYSRSTGRWWIEQTSRSAI